MTKIEALDDCFYDGKVRKKGERVKAVSDEDVRKLVGWGKFKVVEKPEPVYETRQEEPEEEDTSEDRRKRKYMRRDMRPKEE